MNNAEIVVIVSYELWHWALGMYTIANKVIQSINTRRWPISLEVVVMINLVFDWSMTAFDRFVFFTSQFWSNGAIGLWSCNDGARQRVNPDEGQIHIIHIIHGRFKAVKDKHSIEMDCCHSVFYSKSSREFSSTAMNRVLHLHLNDIISCILNVIKSLDSK